MVFRIMMGGSAGFRTMMAFPSSAPPTSSRPAAVVWVNSSMFCRVPGPALFEAMVATISAYSTLDTRFTAWTIGVVAWPPQVTMLMFRVAVTSISSPLTTGTT